MIVRVDIAILFALEEEFKYFEADIPDTKRFEEDQDNGRGYILFDHPIEGNRRYECVASFVGSMGPQDAIYVTGEILRRYNPKSFVLVGLAGSLDKDVRLGDIVIAEEVTDYLQDGKATEVGFEASGRHYRPHIRLTNVIRFLSQRPKIGDEVKANLLGNLKSLVAQGDLEKAGTAARREAAIWHVGHLASGPIVGASAAFATWLRKSRDRKFLALEMESAGVMNAVYQQAGDNRFLVIRGISDMSDERKSSLDGLGSFRSLAMRNALTLLKAVMDGGLFAGGGENPSRPSTNNVAIELDKHNEFVGESEQVHTIAMLLNRARIRDPGPVPVTIVHHGPVFADQRIAELERRKRTKEEQEELRHLHVIKDFLGPAIKEFGDVVDLAVNDDRVHGYLTSDKALSQFLIGLRDTVFGFGTPHFPDAPALNYWHVVANNRPNEWYVWWTGDPDRYFTVRLSEDDVAFIKKSRCDDAGNEVLDANVAFDVYHLSIDATWRSFLPVAIRALLRRWGPRSKVPDRELDFKKWFVSPALPNQAWELPPVHTDEFKRMIERRSGRTLPRLS